MHFSNLKESNFDPKITKYKEIEISDFVGKSLSTKTSQNPIILKNTKYWKTPIADL